MSFAGIYCLEGDWSASLHDRTTVRPLLDLIELANPRTKTVHRGVGTVEELRYYAAKWSQRQYAKFALGWFVMHGEPGRLRLGRRFVTLEEFAEMLGRGACAGKIVYFGGCSVVDDEDAVAEFRRHTAARAVCGYTSDVDWMPAAAFELLLFDELLGRTQAPAAFARLADEHGPFANQLGFRSDPPWARAAPLGVRRT